jgi:hypothetical protein
MTVGTDRLDRPIIILGASRSGTTMLAGQILAGHPQIVYWPEPNFVWRRGNAYRRHDVLTELDATPAIVSGIRRRFSDFLSSHPGRRLMEKTPTNCLRMPFVLKVLPECQVVHVLRDGRDVSISAAKEWAGTGTPRIPGISHSPGNIERAWRNLGHARLRERVFDARSLLELPAYGVQLLGMLRRQLFNSSAIPWGPRFPGLRELRRRHSLLETCALQWDLSVRLARSACLGLPDDRYIEVRYEDLVRQPWDVVRRILEMLDLARDRDLVKQLTAGIQSPPAPRWKALVPDQVISIERLVGTTLRELGYELASTRVGANRDADTT